jgi:hypothetical protein
MNITALYVYSPTTFRSDAKIESMTGATHAAGEVSLPPGIYRVPAGANLVAANGAESSSHSIVALGGTKGGLPDPPLEALQQSNMTAEEIINFFGGTGELNELS